KELSLTYRHLEKTSLLAYSDSDYANCKESRRSYTGYVLLFNQIPFIWKSQKQVRLATSSTHAELVAAFTASTEIIFTRKILEELTVFTEFIERPITLFVDNYSCLRIIQKAEISN